MRLAQIASNASNSTINLAGSGVGPVYSSTPTAGSTFNLGGIQVGSNAAPQPLNITNNTSDGSLGVPTDLTLNSFSITSTHASQFSLSGFTPGQVLSTGASTSPAVNFTPTSAGAKSATLTLFTDEGTAKGKVVRASFTRCRELASSLN